MRSLLAVADTYLRHLLVNPSQGLMVLSRTSSIDHLFIPRLSDNERRGGPVRPRKATTPCQAAFLAHTIDHIWLLQVNIHHTRYFSHLPHLERDRVHSVFPTY